MKRTYNPSVRKRAKKQGVGGKPTNVRTFAMKQNNKKRA